MKRIHVLNLIIISTILLLILLATACSSAPGTPTITATPPFPTLSGTEETTSTPVFKAVEDISQTVAQRTPVPTPTPGPVEQMIIDFTDQSGLSDQLFLGLPTKDWIDLVVAILYILISILLGVYLLFGLVRWAVRRSKTEFDDLFLDTIERELKWFVAIVIIRWTVLRLDFLSEGFRTSLEDILFSLSLILLYIISLRLITFIAKWYRGFRVPAENRKAVTPIIELLKRFGYLFVSMIALSIALSHFGFNITILSAVIIFFGLVIIVAGRAALADAVSGFLIFLDQPFRVGDDINVKELNTWGEVVEIGIRITRIRTADNRQVTIPNSLIGQSQVVNYTYPDPSFRSMTDLGVSYKTDINQLEQIIEEAVRGVEGVLADKSVEVFFLAFGDFGQQIRVQWWIDDVNDQNPMLDRVNKAIQQALNQAGIDMPFPSYDIYMKKENT